MDRVGNFVVAWYKSNHLCCGGWNTNQTDADHQYFAAPGNHYPYNTTAAANPSNNTDTTDHSNAAPNFANNANFANDANAAPNFANDANFSDHADATANSANDANFANHSDIANYANHPIAGIGAHCITGWHTLPEWAEDDHHDRLCRPFQRHHES